MFPFAEEGEGIRYQYLGGEYPTQVQIVLENVAAVCFAVLTFGLKFSRPKLRKSVDVYKLPIRVNYPVIIR